MSNKNKITNLAQKHIQKGQWDKAVKELQKLVAEDPKDVRTLLKLGDVYGKKGDRAEATGVYRQVAEAYTEQGFFLKAVAVYKQILKHEPNQLEVTLKLAELYEQLGLSSEAMAQYQTAAQIYEDSGRAKQGLEVLKRMADLESENVVCRIKLAEGYSRHTMVAEAAKEFQRAADTLKRQGRTEDYVKVAERLVYHDPERIDVLKDLAELYLGRGDTKRGLAKLQLCFKARPKDEGILMLLGTAFQELGQPQKSVLVYRELAKIHHEKGNEIQARAMMQKVLDFEPDDAEARAVLGGDLPSTPEGIDFGSTSQFGIPVTGVAIPARAPKAPPRPSTGPSPGATPLPPQISPATPPASSLAGAEPVEDTAAIAKILTETDVYIKYGLHDKAIEHLRKVFGLDPDNVLGFLKMRDVHLALGDKARASEALASVLSIHAKRNDIEGVHRVRQELEALAPDHPLLESTVDSIDISEDIGIAANPARAVHGEFALRDVSFISMEMDEDPNDEIEVLSGVDPDGDEGFILDPFASNLETRSSVRVDQADIVSAEEMESPDAESTHAGAVAKPSFDDEAFEQEATDAGLDHGPLGGGNFAEGDELLEIPNSAFVELDGMLAADDAPEMMEAAPDLHLMRDEPATMLDRELEDELDEVEFLREQGLKEEAGEAIQDILTRRPHYARAISLSQEIETARLEEAENAEPSDSESESASASEVEDQGAEPGSATDDLLSSLGGPIPQRGDESPEDRFDRGLLFKELGRMDDAIAEFRTSVRASGRAIDSLEMIGHCLIAKGAPLNAIDFFATALRHGPPREAATNLKFEIGAAYEAAADTHNALRWYAASCQDDPEHRDVASRVRALSSRLNSTSNSSAATSKKETGPYSNGPDRNDAARLAGAKKPKISYL